MKKEKVKFHRLTGLLILSLLIVLTGCQHSLDVKNVNDYAHIMSSPLKKHLSVGLMTQTNDMYSEVIAKEIGNSLSDYSSDVRILNSFSNTGGVDVIAQVAINPSYKGSGWNFWINFPGYLVFAPAWNGYKYKVNYDVSVKLMESSSLTTIDSFDIPVDLDVRHADINRTWTGVSWFEYGVIACISGIFFMQYDDSVSPILVEDLKHILGNYIAQKIVDRVNSSKKLAQITKFNVGTSPMVFAQTK